MTDNLDATQNAKVLAAAADLPWTTAPTDDEAAAEILALAGTTEVVIQTEEDLGPKDADLPTIH